MCGKALVRMIRSGCTYDRQLGEVPKDDNPSLFGMHVVGFGLITLVCVIAQVALIVTFVRHLLISD